MIHSDFKGKKVVVMGLGLHGGGVGTAKFFCRQGADVLITDLKSRKELKKSVDKLKKFKVEYVLGEHRKEDFKNADLVIKNPDVPGDSSFLKIAHKHKVPVKTDIGIFFELAKGAYIIGITGTKGKSTTATLVYKFLKSRYIRTFLAGNIGISPLDLISKIKKGDRVVLELSSFELEDLEISPQIAVVTNILADHLNRYKGMKEYIKAKKRIFKFQRKKDNLVLNYDDSIVKRFSSRAKSKVYYFSVGEMKDEYDIKKFKLSGEHNLANISAAIKVAKLLKISDKKILKVLKSFKGVPYRQEFVREARGVKYFNDTTATMPDAAVEAIKSLNKKFPESEIILIAGGQDKGLKYKKMAKEINKKVKEVILLPGTGSDKLKKSLRKKTRSVNSMEEAVKKASKTAEKGDIILLSPGGASFNLFKNEFDRGEQFNKYVKKI